MLTISGLRDAILKLLSLDFPIQSFTFVLWSTRMVTAQDAASNLWQVLHWPFVPILTRLGLAVAIGFFIGLEHEHSGKNGVRTFALTSLLGVI